MPTPLQVKEAEDAQKAALQKAQSAKKASKGGSKGEGKPNSEKAK